MPRSTSKKPTSVAQDPVVVRVRWLVLLAPSYQQENWHKLRHHVKVANSRQSCGPGLYSQLSSRVVGLVYTPSFPRESALMKEQYKITQSSFVSANLGLDLCSQLSSRVGLVYPPGFHEMGLVYTPSFPRELCVGPMFILPASSGAYKRGWCSRVVPLRMVVR